MSGVNLGERLDWSRSPAVELRMTDRTDVHATLPCRPGLVVEGSLSSVVLARDGGSSHQREDAV